MHPRSQEFGEAEAWMNERVRGSALGLLRDCAAGLGFQRLPEHLLAAHTGSTSCPVHACTIHARTGSTSCPAHACVMPTPVLAPAPAAAAAVQMMRSSNRSVAQFITAFDETGARCVPMRGWGAVAPPLM